MKFNIYNTTTVNGNEVTNTKMELEMSVEELTAGYKHTIELLEHSFDIRTLISGIADTVVDTVKKINEIKRNEIVEKENIEERNKEAKEVF